MENSKITRFGYVINKRDLTEAQLTKLKADLIVKPYKPGNFGKFAKDNSFPVYYESGDYICIPKYFGIDRFGQPPLNKIIETKFKTYDMEYIGQLRPKQKIIVDKITNGLDTGYGGMLIAGCGSGKTNMAIYIACKYKLKTLFIIHKGFLKDQIIARIKSTTNVEEVGEIQQKTVKINYPFVVGMIQSIMTGKYDDSIFRGFGMIIIDEVHHYSAASFSKFLRNTTTKYMLGITAERQRNDGTFKLLNWYLGPVLHAEEQQPNDMVVVKKYIYMSSNDDRTAEIRNKYTNEIDRSRMITNLTHIKYRNRFIVNLITELFDQGKNILILSGRIKQVNILHKLIRKDNTMKNMVGKYIGGMSEEALAKSATKQIIFGTYAMAEEGLDIENLNVVILCTPKSAIKQSVGRILRKEVYEEHPIVIDIVDKDIDVFKNQYRQREKYYAKQQYNIQEFKICDFESTDDTYHMWNDLEFISESLSKIPDKKTNTITKESTSYAKPINVDDIVFLDDE